jgi:hypothetical protein
MCVSGEILGDTFSNSANEVDDRLAIHRFLGEYFKSLVLSPEDLVPPVLTSALWFLGLQDAYLSQTLSLKTNPVKASCPIFGPVS